MGILMYLIYIFLFSRAIIEDVYAKSLAKLASSIYGDQEEG